MTIGFAFFMGIIIGLILGFLFTKAYSIAMMSWGMKKRIMFIKTPAANASR